MLRLLNIIELHSAMSTLYPYTTLFRSPHDVELLLHRQRPKMLNRRNPHPLSQIIHRPSRQHPIHHIQRRTHDVPTKRDRKSTRLNSSHVATSYAVCCLKNKIEKIEKQT